jgi:hypothetical protein
MTYQKDQALLNNVANSALQLTSALTRLLS